MLRPNEMLTKEQIIDSVLDGVFVSEEVPTTADWGLRTALLNNVLERAYSEVVGKGMASPTGLEPVFLP